MALEQYLNFFESQNSLEIHLMDLQLFTTYCRDLRNVCATGGFKAQNDIATCSGLIEICFNIMQKFYLNSEVEKYQKPLHMGIQLIGNLIVGHSKNKAFIWLKYFNILRGWTFNEDLKTRNYCEMIIYNLILDIHDVEEHICRDTELLERFILDATNEFEFACFIMEKITANNLKIIYENVSEEKRLNLLTVVRKSLTENYTYLSTSAVNFIKGTTQHCMERVITTDEIPLIEANIAVELLNIISNLSYNSQYKTLLQNDSAFVTLILDKLSAVHKMGLESINAFTPVTKLEEVESTDPHPLHFVRGLLIRIIGNLCYKNKIIQDKVREMNGIYVILDCCKYDAKNPFIMQWSILAVANLCYNNLENQLVIRAMPIDYTKLIKNKKNCNQLEKIEESIVFTDDSESPLNKK
uniref:Ataxin-10 n=1 Tax=Panstrongylus megistus TaxID=65343 RepID=A0A069DT19_9HEMI